MNTQTQTRVGALTIDGVPIVPVRCGKRGCRRSALGYLHRDGPLTRLVGEDCDYQLHRRGTVRFVCKCGAFYPFAIGRCLAAYDRAIAMGLSVVTAPAGFLE